VPFIRELLPPDHHRLVDDFEKNMGVLQPLFDKSSLRKEIINAISDPVISAFIEQNGLSGPFSNFLGTASERLQTLFLNISKGEATLGHTPIAEELLHLIIEKIHAAHKQRKIMYANNQTFEGVKGKIFLEEVAKAEKIQSWLINDLPREVQTMKTAVSVLSIACSFIGFSVGQFNFGTPLMAQALGVLGGVLKFDGISDVLIQQIRKDEPNSPIAKFLEELGEEEKASLIPFVQHQVIPVITALAPVLKERHKNLKIYTEFFQYLNKIIQSNTDINKKNLEKELAQVLSQLFAELKGYGPELDKAFKYLWESE
jgi:hypothetical protein